ncbi:hypothetical protein [Erythrobacter litoralis]|uniref:hypothetical protein n=1 Tax=Erythrobacter litoralis TaxID=39960 RepID=UPI001A7E1A34|nr:hypothetical protein [Erythrobacter litoralis]
MTLLAPWLDAKWAEFTFETRLSPRSPSKDRSMFSALQLVDTRSTRGLSVLADKDSIEQITGTRTRRSKLIADATDPRINAGRAIEARATMVHILSHLICQSSN